MNCLELHKIFLHFWLLIWVRNYQMQLGSIHQEKSFNVCFEYFKTMVSASWSYHIYLVSRRCCMILIYIKHIRGYNIPIRKSWTNIFVFWECVVGFYFSFNWTRISLWLLFCKLLILLSLWYSTYIVFGWYATRVHLSGVLTKMVFYHL